MNPKASKKLIPLSSRAQKQLLKSMLSDTVFNGQKTLNVHEVAAALRVTRQHIMNLIDEGFLLAIDLSGTTTAPKIKNRKNAPRRTIRIPASAYDAYVRRLYSL